jgi:hypothetical protein
MKSPPYKFIKIIYMQVLLNYHIQLCINFYLVMSDSGESQCKIWPDLTDTASSELENPPSWSNFTDSDALDAQLPAISTQVHSGASWSPCPSWSASDWSPCKSWSSSDWSPCPPWSSSESNNHPQAKWEEQSLQSGLSSQPSDKHDKDYNPGSTFGPLLPVPKPQSASNTSDNVMQPSQTIRKFS